MSSCHLCAKTPTGASLVLPVFNSRRMFIRESRQPTLRYSGMRADLKADHSRYWMYPLGSQTVKKCCACSVTALGTMARSEEHTSELQSRGQLVCRLLLGKKKTRSTSA